MNQLWFHSIATVVLESFIVHSYRFCVFSWIFEIFSCKQVSNKSNLGSKDECIIYIWSFLNHWHKGTFMQLCGKVWGKKKVWSGRRRLQYQAELSVCWSSKCQTIHIHLFGRLQQRGSALREGQTEMADISAFKRLTAAHKQHANAHTLSENTHMHLYLHTWHVALS